MKKGDLVRVLVDVVTWDDNGEMQKTVGKSVCPINWRSQEISRFSGTIT